MTVTANKRAPQNKARTAALAAAYAERRLEKRSQWARRASHRVQRPVNKEKLPTVGIDKQVSKPAVRVGRGLAYTIVALLIHGSLVIGLSLLRGESFAPRDRSRVAENVTVEIKQPPPASKPEPEKETTVVADEKSVVQTVDKKEPLVEKIVKKKRVAKAGKKRSKTPPDPGPDPGPQADPIDLDNAPSEVADSKPRRRVVGISFESTVSGGKGPSFAVGNTRMGETEDQASDPNKVEKLRGEALRVGDEEEVGPNRVATAIPSAKKELKRPTRISEINLRYPRSLKEQGIEGNVVVLIRIAADGSVKRVKVIKSSGYPEFDDAAARAASSERFKPATRDGEPIDYSLKYTYRFRIKQV